MIFDLPHIILYLLIISLVVSLLWNVIDYICIKKIKSILDSIFKLPEYYSFTDKELNVFSDNISIISRCIFNSLKSVYNYLEIYNITKDKLTRFIVDNKINCSEIQLEIYKFINKYYSECSKDQVIKYVKDYFSMGETIIKPRILERDFDELSPIDRDNLKLFIYDQDCISENRCLIDKDCQINKVCNTDVRFCGCPKNLTLCSENCVNLLNDKNNCGSCGIKCTKSGEICIAGKCDCSIGLARCKDTCTSLLSDINNCGRCGNTCSSGKICIDGQCI